MAAIINVTQQLVIASNAPMKQPLAEALDVSGYDILDIQFYLASWTGPTTPSVVLQVDTSMQNEVDDATWTPMYPVYYGIAIPQTNIISLNNSFLRYIRWNVSALATGQTIIFSMRGMARRNGE